ncbi:unnamed protein product [Closterium sp. NIES-54]
MLTQWPLVPSELQMGTTPVWGTPGNAREEGPGGAPALSPGISPGVFYMGTDCGGVFQGHLSPSALTASTPTPTSSCSSPSQSRLDFQFGSSSPSAPATSAATSSAVSASAFGCGSVAPSQAGLPATQESQPVPHHRTAPLCLFPLPPMNPLPPLPPCPQPFTPSTPLPTPPPSQPSPYHQSAFISYQHCLPCTALRSHSQPRARPCLPSVLPSLSLSSPCLHIRPAAAAVAHCHPCCGTLPSVLHPIPPSRPTFPATIHPIHAPCTIFPSFLPSVPQPSTTASSCAACTATRVPPSSHRASTIYPMHAPPYPPSPHYPCASHLSALHHSAFISGLHCHPCTALLSSDPPLWLTSLGSPDCHSRHATGCHSCSCSTHSSGSTRSSTSSRSSGSEDLFFRRGDVVEEWYGMDLTCHPMVSRTHHDRSTMPYASGAAAMPWHGDLILSTSWDMTVKLWSSAIPFR